MLPFPPEGLEIDTLVVNFASIATQGMLLPYPTTPKHLHAQVLRYTFLLHHELSQLSFELVVNLRLADTAALLVGLNTILLQHLEDPSLLLLFSLQLLLLLDQLTMFRDYKFIGLMGMEQVFHVFMLSEPRVNGLKSHSSTSFEVGMARGVDGVGSGEEASHFGLVFVFGELAYYVLDSFIFVVALDVLKENVPDRFFGSKSHI